MLCNLPSAAAEEPPKPGSGRDAAAQLPSLFASQLALQPPSSEALRFRQDMRNMRIGQTMQALEIQRLRIELDGSAALRVDQNSEISFLRSELSRTRLVQAERSSEISRLRCASACSCLRPEMQLRFSSSPISLLWCPWLAMQSLQTSPSILLASIWKKHVLGFRGYKTYADRTRQCV